MMIRFLSALLTLAVLVPTATAQTETVAFVKKKPEVGDRRTDSGRMSTNMTIEISMGGQVVQSMDQNQLEEDEIRTTILAKEGDQVTKLEIHCINKVSAQTGPAGEMKEESPLVGKTVIANWNGGDIQVTDAEGKPVDADVEAAAREEARGTFTDSSNEFDKVLPDRPIEVGEKIVVDPKLARTIFAQGDDSPLDDVEMSLTLKGRQEHNGHDCGLFGIVLTMKGEASEGVNIVAELEGELLLGIESTWPHSMNLQGDFKVSGTQSQGGQSIEFSGKGPMEMSRTAVYEKM